MTAQAAPGRKPNMVSAAEQLAANLNFSALAKADELKKRIWFTLGALLVYRLGTYIPLPGIDPAIWEQVFKSQAGGILGMFNMFAGGGIHRMAIFALNIMPYISASIIIQLLTTVSPQLEALKKEGEAGRKTLNQYTRYLTVILAAFQSYGIAVGLEGAGNVVSDPGLFFRLSTAITLTGGTMFLMWLGEQITSRGIGNGISLIILSGIVAELPSALASMLELGRQGAGMVPVAQHAIEPWPAAVPVSLSRADRVLRVLLHRDRIQPDGNRRQSQKARRLHSGHPSGRTDRRIYRLRAVAHHGARRDLSGDRLSDPGNSDFLRLGAVLLRRYLAPDRRQRDDGYGGAGAGLSAGASIRRPDPQIETAGP